MSSRMCALRDLSLDRYLPVHALDHLRAHPAPMEAPSSRRFEAALLFADISGFTALTERLAAQGPAGAEEISQHLNAYFGRLVDLVVSHGGDVISFAGDALLALWEAPDDGLVRSTRLAAQCARVVQEELGAAHAEGDVRFTQRICVAAGPITTAFLGGVGGRWELVATGRPLAQIGAASRHARPGEVVLSREAWGLTSDAMTGEPVEDGAVRLTAVQAPLAATPLAPVALPDEADESLRALLPGVVLSRVNAGQSEWMGELRRVTVLFVGLPPIFLEDELPLERAQLATSIIQEAVRRYGGSINKISIDEKGATVVSAYGLPPFSHEDDPVRAVRTALRIQRELAPHGLRGSIGVASGRVFCGLVGNARRSEYTIYGSVVNTAARLMAAAEGGILCETTTRKAAEQEFAFAPEGHRALKGLDAPLRVYRPTGETVATQRGRIVLVGRSRERGALVDRIERIVRARDSAVLVLEGEAGIGKSRLVEEALWEARTRGLRAVQTAADPVESSTPYFAWRGFVGETLGFHPGDHVEGRRARVLDRLAGDEEATRLAPLLNAVLPLDLEDDELTAQMSGEVRAHNTRKLLARLVRRFAGEEPVLVVIEDAHWLDSASWGVLQHVARDTPSSLILLATRPIPEPVPSEYISLLSGDAADKIAIERFSHEESASLIRARLGVLELPNEVAEVIHQRAEGNPLFTEELAYVLRDSGQILVDGEECRLSVSPEDFLGARFPDSIEAVVTSRVDQLDAQQQLLLKVASVVGRSFPVHLVRDLYPVGDDRDTVPSLLAPLEQLDVIRPAPPPDEAYMFKHALTQEAVYNLMLFAQRRELHRSVAEWHERNDPPDVLRGHFELLAHHWQSAEDWPRSVDYLERAGGVALASDANTEVQLFYERAIEMDRTHGLQTEARRRGAWERDLAEAHFRLGNLTGCRQHGRRALSALGRRPPRHAAATAVSLLKQVALRALQRWFPRLFAVKDPDERERRVAATRVQNRITEVAIYQEDALGCLDSGLRELNTAEPLGPTAELGRAYAVLAVVLGSVPLHRVARAWCRRALDAADAIGQPVARAYVLSRVAVYDLDVGHLAVAVERLEQAIEITRTVDDRRLREEAMSILAKVLYYGGQLRRARRVWEEVGLSSRHSGSEQTYAWSLFGRAANLLRLGSAAEALPLLDESMSWVTAKATASEEVWVYGLAALTHLRLGDHDKARAIADRILPLVVARPVAYWTQQSNAAVAEVYLRLWERGDDDARRPAERAVRACRAFARIFPFGRAQALLWRGCFLHLAGEPAKARKAWEHCIDASEALSMPYERGRTHFEMGRVLPREAADRRRHLEKALALLEPIGAMWEVQAARKLL
jgi:class 3 adenylate cyclase/tetratricopeptide (TPR) repeat protein